MIHKLFCIGVIFRIQVYSLHSMKEKASLVIWSIFSPKKIQNLSWHQGRDKHWKRRQDLDNRLSLLHLYKTSNHPPLEDSSLNQHQETIFYLLFLVVEEINNLLVLNKVCFEWWYEQIDIFLLFHVNRNKQKQLPETQRAKFQLNIVFSDRRQF